MNHMTYDEFIDFVTKCMYETIYKDSEGRLILVINLLDAYEMSNKLKEKNVDGNASIRLCKDQ